MRRHISITICTHNQELLFGHVQGNEMILNDYGFIVHETRKKIPGKYSNINLDVFKVMPNHFRAIVFIGDTLKNPVEGIVPYREIVQNLSNQNSYQQGHRIKFS